MPKKLSTESIGHQYSDSDQKSQTETIPASQKRKVRRI